MSHWLKMRPTTSRLYFPAFFGWYRKATGDGQFRYFRRLFIPRESRLKYPGLLYQKEEWSYLDFWQLTSQTYLRNCLLLRALFHINFFRKIRKSKGMFFFLEDPVHDGYQTTLLLLLLLLPLGTRAGISIGAYRLKSAAYLATFFLYLFFGPNSKSHKLRGLCIAQCQNSSTECEYIPTNGWV